MEHAETHWLWVAASNLLLLLVVDKRPVDQTTTAELAACAPGRLLCQTCLQTLQHNSPPYLLEEVLRECLPAAC